MNFENPLFLVNALCGGIFVIAGIVLQVYPPKKINWLYGYRTKRSMQSQASWGFAQQHGGKQMIASGVLMLLLGIPGIWIDLPLLTGLAISLALVVALAIITIYRTEKKLEQKFPH